MWKDLLNYHPESNKKLLDLKEIIVDFNPSYPRTRCFFVVNSEGKKESFSFYKSVSAIFK